MIAVILMIIVLIAMQKKHVFLRLERLLKDYGQVLWGSGAFGMPGGPKQDLGAFIIYNELILTF